MSKLLATSINRLHEKMRAICSECRLPLQNGASVDIYLASDFQPAVTGVYHPGCAALVLALHGDGEEEWPLRSVLREWIPSERNQEHQEAWST